MRLANLSSGISSGAGRTFELSELFDMTITVPAPQESPAEQANGGGGRMIVGIPIQRTRIRRTTRRNESALVALEIL